TSDRRGASAGKSGSTTPRRASSRSAPTRSGSPSPPGRLFTRTRRGARTRPAMKAAIESEVSRNDLSSRRDRSRIGATSRTGVRPRAASRRADPRSPTAFAAGQRPASRRPYCSIARSAMRCAPASSRERRGGATPAGAGDPTEKRRQGHGPEPGALGRGGRQERAGSGDDRRPPPGAGDDPTIGGKDLPDRVGEAIDLPPFEAGGDRLDSLLPERRGVGADDPGEPRRRLGAALPPPVRRADRVVALLDPAEHAVDVGHDGEALR